MPQRIRNLKARLKPIYSGAFFPRVISFIRRRPLTSFFAALIILFLLIVAGNLLFKQPAPEAPKAPVAKDVRVYTIGQVPKTKVQAKVQKNGVIVIMAQAPGVVQEIAVKEGDEVQRGTNLVSLSTNYQGGNAASLQRQLAQVQLQNVLDTYDTQKNLINRQRDLANLSADNAEDLRKISVQTLDDTNSLLSLNMSIANAVNANLQNLISTHQSSDLVLAAQQQMSSVQAAVNQLTAQSRALTFSNDPKNPPAQIALLTKDATLKQLDIQERALRLSKEAAQISVNLAAVQESLMFPSSPTNGTVQKVSVHVGQQVGPGTPLITIYSPEGNVSAIAKVPQNIAQSISGLEPSQLNIGSQVISVYPSFVSTQATDDQLYSIIFNIPDGFEQNVTDQGYISIDIPVGHTDSNSVVPFIPLDAVFQTTDEAYVYVFNNGKAVSRVVKLGQVLGADVEVEQGIGSGDQIILNRNVIAGDSVKIN